MTDEQRRAYIYLTELLESAGYEILDEDFGTIEGLNEFEASFNLVAPDNLEPETSAAAEAARSEFESDSHQRDDRT